MTYVRINPRGGDSLLALTSPRCLQSVFRVSCKPLLSMVIHVLSKLKLNKICGKDHPLAREDIHATNTCKMR